MDEMEEFEEQPLEETEYGRQALDAYRESREG